MCYYFARESGGEVLWWVCLYVCLSVREHISRTTRAIFTKFLCMLPIGPSPAGWRNPKGKAQFWGFSSPLTLHCNAFAANGIIQYRPGRGDGSAQRGLCVIYESLVCTCFRIQHSLLHGDRSFSIAGPRVWNTLPASVRDTNSSLRSRKLLKAFLFVWRPRRRWRWTGALKMDSLTYLLTYLLVVLVYFYIYVYQYGK